MVAEQAGLRPPAAYSEAAESLRQRGDALGATRSYVLAHDTARAAALLVQQLRGGAASVPTHSVIVDTAPSPMPPRDTLSRYFQSANLAC